MPLISFTGCATCSLKREWPNLTTPKMAATIPSQPTDYRALFIGEGPGATEDKLGRQFVGDSGQYLRKLIPREWNNKLYFQNIVRCRPPNNRTPSVQEVACCSTFLEQDLQNIRPHAIFGMGDPALKYFWPDGSISRCRGIPFPVKIGKELTSWYFPSFHPSYVMRSERREEDGSYTNYVLPVFKNDITRFFRDLPTFAATSAQIIQPPKDIFYPKTIQEARQLFARLARPWFVDFETFKLRPHMRDALLLTTAFSDGDLTFAFPVQWPGYRSTGWGMEALIEFMQEDDWGAQGSAMELSWAWYHSKHLPERMHDTELKARLIHQRRGINALDELSRLYLGFDIKKLSKVQSKNQLHLDYPLDVVLEYNALDAWSEAKIDKILTTKLTQTDWENYNRTIPAIKSTVAMELAGLPVDLEVSEKLEQNLLAKEKEIESKVRQQPEIIKYEQTEHARFSISSPQTVGHVLANYCGINLPKTEDNNWTTADEVLQEWVERCLIAGFVLDWREVDKQLGTYVIPIISGAAIGVDGLIHPCYKTIHTATYRLSSEWPNIQNFPKRKHKEVRAQIVAPKGYIIVAFDYGQLEARVFTMASRDIVLREAFLKDVDIHSKWRDRIIELYPPYLDRLAEKSGQTELSKILKAGRDTIKTDFVFASFYGSRAKSIANRAMLPQAVADKVLGEFWSEYNGARAWIDAKFRSYAETGKACSLTGRFRDEVLPGNEVINTPIQGTAAEIVLEAQNFLFFYSIATKQYEFMPRINIHDDLVFFLRDDNELGNKIEFIGKEIVKPRFPFITTPLITECRVGYNWAELNEVAKFRGDYYEIN